MRNYRRILHRKQYFAIVIVFLLAVLLLVFLNQYQLPSDSHPTEIGNLPKVVLAADNNYPPFEYADSNGQARGYNVDILKAVSLVEGFDLTILPMDFAEARTALEQGRVDGILGMSQTEEREILYDFAEPYLTMRQRIFVRADNQYILTKEDLNNARVAVQAGDIANEIIADINPIETIHTANQEEAFNLLAEDKVDAVVVNELTGLYFAQQMHLEHTVKMVGDSFTPTGYGIAVQNGNTSLVYSINRGLDVIQTNGTYDQIYKHWFGEPIGQPIISRQFLSILLIILAVLFTITVVVMIWNRSLSRMVQHRTSDLAIMNQQLADLNHELSKAYEFEKVILNNAFSGIIAFGLNHTILSINVHAAKILKLDPKNYEKQDIYSIPLFESLATQNLIRRDNLMDEFINVELSTLINGQERRLKLALSVFISEEKPHEEKIHNGFILTFVDITEEWILRQRVQRQDKLEALGQIAAGIAHEIRNPLTSIKGFIQLLPSKYHDPQFRESLVSCLPEEVSRLEDIVNDMLDLTRKKTPVRSYWDLQALVQSVIILIEKSPKFAKIKLFTEVPDNLTIFADRQQVKQVLINLLLNAGAAINGTGRVMLRASALSSEYIRIEVEDNGCGISKEGIQKVFDPFYTTKADGTGLGLATTYQYIQENGGEISLRSSEGNGTVVSILLPTSQISKSKDSSAKK